MTNIGKKIKPICPSICPSHKFAMTLMKSVREVSNSLSALISARHTFLNPIKNKEDKKDCRYGHKQNKGESE
jgi:hypothetical protein